MPRTPRPPPDRGPDPDPEDEGKDLPASPTGDEEEGPWPITVRPPASSQAWLAELVAAYGHAGDPPPLETEDGKRFLPEAGDLLARAVTLALQARGARIPVEAVYGLIGVIRDLVDELADMGPEWSRLVQVPPLAFTVYYVWAHVVIGHVSEDLGMDVVRAATEHLEAFDAAS